MKFAIVISVLIGFLIAFVQKLLINKRTLKAEKLYSEHHEQIQKALKHIDRLKDNEKTKSNGVLNVYGNIYSAEWSMGINIHKVSTEIPYVLHFEKIKNNILEEYNHNYHSPSILSV